ncbi:MAG: hypothetical protein RL375_1046 [Pseudomonadota bacterium]
MPDTDISQLQATIVALEAQRALLGDAAVNAAVAALREKLGRAQPGVAQPPTAPPPAPNPTAPAPDAQGELRHVSVLFTDVVGSTTLSHHLDAEDVTTVIDGALGQFTALVQAHGGKVLQYAGDSVLAVFGAHQAREDDAERAVLAGLAIVAEGRRQGELVLARHGRTGFGVRVGINSGPVLIGGGLEGANSVRGMTVNIAARMEQTAPPGTLRISQETYREVRGRFDLIEQAPLTVKGREDAMVTYLVQGVRGAAERGATRGVDGVATRMVGRAAQLADLQAWCPPARPTPSGAASDGPTVDDAGAELPPGDPALRVVHVVGDAGLGKSRLVAELRRWWLDATPRGAWQQAQASEQRIHQPYGLLRGLLTSRSDLLDSDADDVARRKWLGSTTPLLGSEAAAAVLGHLLGLDFSTHDELRGLLVEARQLRDRAFFHATQLLRAWAAPDRPLVLLLDDVHWADDGTLDFIDHLRTTQVDLPALLILATRPSLTERRPAWFGRPAPDSTAPRAGTPAGGVAHIELAPLNAGQSGELVGELLGRLQPLPQGLVELIVEHGEGNPFHMEELVNLMVDQGVIVTAAPPKAPGDTRDRKTAAAATWQFHPEKLKALTVPPTLVGVLQARLDALPGDERRTAQLASVVGMRFWDASLAALGAPPLTSLQGLLGRELAAEQLPGSLAGLREFVFKHQSLHQVAYDSVLKRVKRDLHARVAHWLVSLPGAAPLDLVAEHFERGGDHHRALEYWQLAAQAAARSYANAQALAHADRALALTRPDDLPRRYALALLRCRVLELLPDRDQRASSLSRLQAIADTADQAAWQAECRVRRSRFCFDAGEDLEALEHAQAAVALLGDGTTAQAAEAHASLARSLLRLGRRTQSLDEFMLALRLARGCGDLRIQGIVLNDLGMQADEEGDHATAIERYTDALHLHRQIGNRNNEGGTLSNLGYAAMALGDYETACARFGEARRLFAAVGHRQNEAVTWINLGIAELNLDHPAEALTAAEKALPMVRAAGARWLEASALRLQGQAESTLGQVSVARQHLTRSCELFEQLGMAHLALEPIAALAQLALQTGDYPAAMAEVDRILAQQALGVSLDGTEEPLRVALICHQVLATCGDPRAAEVLGQAHASLTERATRISSAARRHSFLDRVPYHRQIVRAWSAVSGDDPN